MIEEWKRLRKVRVWKILLVHYQSCFQRCDVPRNFENYGNILLLLVIQFTRQQFFFLNFLGFLVQTILIIENFC